MKIAEYKGTEAIDLLAEIMIPVCKIIEDEELRNYLTSGGVSNLGMVQKILKSHPEEILDIMALVDQEDRETYEPNIFVLPARLIELFSMPEMKMLFLGQGQKTDGERSGSATETTGAPEK